MSSFYTIEKPLIVCFFKSLICILLLSLIGCQEDQGFLDEEYKSRIIAHRGYWKNCGVPENSLQSFINAALAGLYGCEIDVWETADGELVVNHDAVIDSCIIAEMRYRELRNILTDERKCEKLSSFLEILPDYPGFKLLIEIKNAPVSSILNQIFKYGVESQIEFQSFDSAVCRELVDSEFTGRILCTAEDKLLLSHLVSEGYSGYSLYYFNLDNKYLQQSHALGLLVYVWTVGEKKWARRLLNMGVDCVIMDYWE